MNRCGWVLAEADVVDADIVLVAAVQISVVDLDQYLRPGQWGGKIKRCMPGAGAVALYEHIVL